MLCISVQFEKPGPLSVKTRMCFNLHSLQKVVESFTIIIARFIDNTTMLRTLYFSPDICIISPCSLSALKSASAAPTGELGSRRNPPSRVKTPDGGTHQTREDTSGVNTPDEGTHQTCEHTRRGEHMRRDV